MLKRIAIFLTASVVYSSAYAAERTVNLLSWDGVFSQQLLDRFTKETGIRVVYDPISSDEIVETKILAGKSGYDIVIMTFDPYISRMVAAGALQMIDASEVPNLKSVNPKIVAQTDEKLRPYAAMFDWGHTGLVLSKRATDNLPADAKTDSLALIFDPKNAQALSKCGLTFLDSPTDMIPLALMYLGLDPASTDPRDLKRVEELFAGVRPYVRKFDTEGYVSELATGDICAAVGYSSSIYKARAAAKDAGSDQGLQYVIPREGGILWASAVVLPKDAANTDEAQELMNFLLSAEAGADHTQTTGLPTTVLPALELLDKALLADPIVFPPEGEMKRLRLFSSPAKREEIQRMTRSWTRITTGN